MPVGGDIKLKVSAFAGISESVAEAKTSRVLPGDRT